MSGSPTETEVQTQWRNVVGILETTRVFADETLAGAGNRYDVALQALEGDFTPAGIAGAVQRHRAGMSGLLSQQTALDFLTPVLMEYRKLLIGGGSGYRDARTVFEALRDHFVLNTLSVNSRAITFDTSAVAIAGYTNVGNGAMSRLTVDHEGFPLEAVTVERKQFRCRRDRNNGAREHAEQFEHLGAASSQDWLGLPSFGSGEGSRRTIVSKNGGTQEGGSLLQNSSFDAYVSTAAAKFTNWTETAGGAQITEHTADYYRGNPSTGTVGTNRSLRINGGGGTVTLRQQLRSMRQTQLREDVPYFLRVMVNKTVGTASGGNVVVRLGSVTVTTSIASLSAGWNEIIVPIGTSCWLRNFNPGSDLAIDIEWASSTSGYLLVDDVIFCEWDFIDGTWWLLRGNAATHASWALDDTLEVTDTGGAPATGKIQYWLWRAGLGCLPSNNSAAETFADPA